MSNQDDDALPQRRPGSKAPTPEEVRALANQIKWLQLPEDYLWRHSTGLPVGESQETTTTQRGVAMTGNEVWDVAMEWVVIMKFSAKADLSHVECDAWCKRDPSHRIAYEDACRYWERLNQAVALLQQGRPSSPEALLSEIAEVARRGRRHRDGLKWRIARVLRIAVRRR
jgi:hypothetical protein